MTSNSQQLNTMLTRYYYVILYTKMTGPCLYHIKKINITFTSTCHEKLAVSHKIDFQNLENKLSHNFFKVINKNDLLVS